MADQPTDNHYKDAAKKLGAGTLVKAWKLPDDWATVVPGVLLGGGGSEHEQGEPGERGEPGEGLGIQVHKNAKKDEEKAAVQTQKSQLDESDDPAKRTGGRNRGADEANAGKVLNAKEKRAEKARKQYIKLLMLLNKQIADLRKKADYWQGIADEYKQKADEQQERIDKIDEIIELKKSGEWDNLLPEEKKRRLKEIGHDEDVSIQVLLMDRGDAVNIRDQNIQKQEDAQNRSDEYNRRADEKEQEVQEAVKIEDPVERNKALEEAIKDEHEKVVNKLVAKTESKEISAGLREAFGVQQPDNDELAALDKKKISTTGETHKNTASNISIDMDSFLDDIGEDIPPRQGMSAFKEDGKAIVQNKVELTQSFNETNVTKVPAEDPEQTMVAKADPVITNNTKIPTNLVS